MLALYHFCVLLQITSNPAMNGDTRNQGLIGMSDGIPMFKDKSSGTVVPVMLRTGNLEDHLSMKFRYVHLAALVPGHFWITGLVSGQFEKVNRKPSHLGAVLHAVVDDLLQWEQGHRVEDFSKHLEDPARWFRLCAILLYWCGDYPGQGEASGFSHAALGKKSCHWCEINGLYCKGIGRTRYGGYYRSVLNLLLISCCCPTIYHI